MNIELGNRIALADQLKKLSLGSLQSGIGHHVEKADMELAYMLLLRTQRLKHGLPGVAQAVKSR